MCWLFTVLDLPHSPEHTVHNREWISVPVRDSCCIPVSVFARTFHWQLSYKHKLFFLNSNKMPVKHKHNGIVTFTQFPRASLQRKQTEAVALTRSCHTFSTPLSIENSYSTVSFSAAMNRGYGMHLYFCLCVCVCMYVCHSSPWLCMLWSVLWMLRGQQVLRCRSRADVQRQRLNVWLIKRRLSRHSQLW